MKTEYIPLESKPFCWNLTSKSELGKLIDEDYVLDTGFLNQVRDCTVDLVSLLDESHLVFVGRSLESIHVYLNGLTKDTFWYEDLINLNVSLYSYSISDIRTKGLKYINALKHHFCTLGLHPENILLRPKLTTFVDVVHEGSTFRRIYQFLIDWAKEQHFDVPAVKRKLKFVGVMRKRKSTPKAWTWNDIVNWDSDFPNVKNVLIDRWLWSYIADGQEKMTRSVTLDKWLSRKILSPAHNEGNIKALNQAYSLYCIGQSKGERRQFTKQLATKRLPNRFHRKLILDIKGL